MNPSARIVRRWRQGMLAASALSVVSLGIVLLASEQQPDGPDTNVRVVSFSPTGTTQQSSNIVIEFSNDLVSKDSLDRPTDQRPVVFEPVIDGVARWVTTNTLVVYPGTQLRPATEYTATIHSSAGWVNGNIIGRRQTFTFRTSPLMPRVDKHLAVRIREDQKLARLLIDLSFNYPVKREELKQAISIHGECDATASSLSVNWPDTTLTGEPWPTEATEYRLATEPFKVSRDEQVYRLQIEAGLACVACGGSLAGPFRYNLTVPRNPKLDMWVEGVQADQPGKQGQISIRLSRQAPSEEVEQHVKIEPPVDFVVQTDWRGAFLVGHFKPQTSYTVDIKAGMMSVDGSILERDFSTKVAFGDLRPALSFSSPGLYLPSEGSGLLKFSTVNIDSVTLEIEQVFANNLVPYLVTRYDRSRRHSQPGSPFGRLIYAHDYGLDANTNEYLTSTIDAANFPGDTLSGVFVLSLRNKSGRWMCDSRHTLRTDLGLIARLSDNELLVWVNRLSDVKPVRNARVKLFSRTNQVLLEGKTNSRGAIVFTDIAEHLDGFTPFLITAEYKDDLSYLRLDNSRLPYRAAAISGRPYLTKGYEAFLYADRGVYRPGEAVHAISMVRGRGGNLPSDFAYTVEVTDPRRKSLREYRLNAATDVAELDIEILADAATGRYTAVARIDDQFVLGSVTFLVEEFAPERIKVTVETTDSVYLAGDTLDLTVRGRMLYGPPAAGYRGSAKLVLIPRPFRAEDYSGYSFTHRDRSESPKTVSIGEFTLSNSGEAGLRYRIPDNTQPPGYFRAGIEATVNEPGGRGVTGHAEAVVHPYSTYVGVLANVDGYARTGNPVTADFIAVDKEGKAIADDSVEITFSRVIYNTVLRRLSDDRYRYESEITLDEIDSRRVTIGSEGLSHDFTPEAYGRYRIEVRDLNGYHAATTEFYASGWGRVPWSMEEPDRLELDLDQDNYRPGSVAKLQVRAPFSGKLLVTIENASIQKYFTVDMPENTAELDIPVERDYSPNVYVAATLIRPAGEVTKHSPARAYGIAPILVTPEERRLDVTLTAPEVVKPRTKISVGVETSARDSASVTVAAVDAGILQLTEFSTPDPFSFFYGQRRPVLGGFDMYNLIYPETERAASHLPPPGGVSEDITARRAFLRQSPFAARRINVVSLWSGIVRTDADGRADVELEIPEFNGQLTLMAVAASGDRVGSATTNTIVREDFVLQESFPRFVAPRDSVCSLLTVYNTTDTAAVLTVTVDITDPLQLLSPASRRVSVQAGREIQVPVEFRAADAPGIARVNLSVADGAYTSRVSFELASRPAQPLALEHGSGVVTADSAALIQLPGDYLPGTSTFLLRTSTLAGMQVTRSIEYLLRYPYGCIEQTTSALFPLLYFNDLARIVRPELLGGKGHEYFLAEGIDRLERRQSVGGAFTYWPGTNRINIWASIYASHFLVEAQLAGYEVSKDGHKQAISFVSDIARMKTYNDIDQAQRIYACLVLAKAGKLNHKLYNYLTALDELSLKPFSRYQLAAALALSGDIGRAKEILPTDIQPDLSPPEDGGNFSSGTRTTAILLDLLVEIEPDNPSTFALAKELMERLNINRWYNTQSTAFALMALGKFFSLMETTEVTGQISIGGSETIPFDTEGLDLLRKDIGGRSVQISITSGSSCFYYWQARGVPADRKVEQVSNGILVERTYLDEKGQPVSLDSIPLGTRLVGHIEVKAEDNNLRNVVISDLLPAGLEIENPRLASSPTMSWLPQKPQKPEYQDVRDDRLLLFTDLHKAKEYDFYYGVRAIARGDFIVPPIQAECMYNPLVNGSTAPDRMRIVNW